MAFEAFYSATTARPASRLARWLAERVSPGGRALDIGCGSGADAAYLASLGFEVDAIEPNPAAPDVSGAGVRFSRAGALDFEAAPGTYRAILCSNVLPFLVAPGEIEAALRRISTLLAEDGLAALSIFGERDGWAGRADVRVVPAGQAEEMLLGAGLSRLEAEVAERDQKPAASDVEKHWHILRFLCARRP